MKNLIVSACIIPDIKIIKYEKYKDDRGYFMEHFRKNEINSLEFMENFQIEQSNESFSYKNTLRGLHFQWDPPMGKLVRLINGHMIDFILDIRLGSPTFGKIFGIELKSNETIDECMWIWIPVGFAHGCFFIENSILEYYCTSHYNGKGESGINPFTKDIEWDLCDTNLLLLLDGAYRNNSIIISDRDKNGHSLTTWKNNVYSYNFMYNIYQANILITGGSGLLGSELKKIFSNSVYPTSIEFNITNFEQMDSFMHNKLNSPIKIILHAAAFTPPPDVEKNPMKGLSNNIQGTSNIVKLCEKYKIKLIYISTDYVFDGKNGNYKETDPVHPINKYAISKLGGECAVKMYDCHVIIRLSFGPNIFPYDKAFIDQYTSREPVNIIARKIANIIIKYDYFGIIHIGSNRKTVYDYAKELGCESIKPLSIHDIDTPVPIDTSLNCELYEKIFN